jgi:methylated-DNA-[protein]-cysteine S-methyltransferase
MAAVSRVRGDAVVAGVMIVYTTIDSPIGPLLAARDGSAVVEIRFAPAHPEETWMPDHGAFDDVRSALADYFAGCAQKFALPLDPRGTAFQKSVWSALRDIPFGSTATYRDIACRIGKPEAVRAVGAANGANPIPIVIPCHRVIGSNGSLTGFGGGLPVKRWLLDHEARVAGARLF